MQATNVVLPRGPARAYGEPALRRVLAHPRRASASAHEAATQNRLASEIARLFGWEFLPENDDSTERHAALRPYYVPCDTLVGAQAAAGGAPLRVNGQDDLFGGVVPFSFVASKAITHRLIDAHAQRPAGWSVELGRQLHNVVLRGATVFSIEDARRAGAALLHHGPIRLKPVDGIAGRGQLLLEDKTSLDSALGEYEAKALADGGLVLEEHLEDITTFSVGHVQVADSVSAYVGTQCLTRDNAGVPVYGGSDLRLVRGDFDALLALELSDAEREAIRLARAYDRAAMNCYPGLYASRRNYDVAQGRDAAGIIRMGVLEQSWRAGGASMAEIYALEAFMQRPRLRSVRAFTCERYGNAAELPDKARITYQGEDEKVGWISKCAGIYSYDDK